MRFFCIVLVGLFFHCSFSFAENIFRMRLVADPKTLDWHLAGTNMETPFLMNIMEGLFEYDSKMNPEPLLCQSYQRSLDGKTYTFKIKKNVKWSDGKVLAAEDFVSSWKRLISPLTGSPYAYLLFDVQGAEDFYNGKAELSAVGIKAVDESTVQVTLRRPVPYFLHLLTFWATFPIRKDVVDKNGVSWTKPGNIVVLGPYQLTSAVTGKEYVLKKNSLYHAAFPKNAIDLVRMKVIEEDSTALNLFKTGMLDFVRPINFFEIEKQSETGNLHQDQYLRTCFINFNTTKYPLNLPKVRLALAHGIDRAKIEKLLHKSVKATQTLLPEFLLSGASKVGPEFNPKKAKELLSEVGVDAKSFSDVELLSFASDENTLITQFIQEQMKSNLGLSIKVRLPEFKTYRTLLELGSSHLFYRCWGADYADPDSYFAIFSSTSGNNRTGWKNSTYDQLVTKAAGEMNKDERQLYYKKALDLLLNEQAPISPLLYDSLLYLLNPKFKGFKINSLNYFNFKNVSAS